MTFAKQGDINLEVLPPFRKCALALSVLATLHEEERRERACPPVGIFEGMGGVGREGGVDFIFYFL